ncbi:hypothetical protein [Glutamicibacter ardleyensis]|nr:hypothetical protein [Glutamicibacter ardleyensis]
MNAFIHERVLRTSDTANNQLLASAQVMSEDSHGNLNIVNLLADDSVR